MTWPILLKYIFINKCFEVLPTNIRPNFSTFSCDFPNVQLHNQQLYAFRFSHPYYLCHSSSMKVLFLLGKSISSSLLKPYFSQFHDFFCPQSVNVRFPIPELMFLFLFSPFGFLWCRNSCLIRKCVLNVPNLQIHNFPVKEWKEGLRKNSCFLTTVHRNPPDGLHCRS